MNKILTDGTKVEYRRYDVLGGTRYYATGVVTGNWNEDGYCGYYVKLDQYSAYGLGGREVWGYDVQVKELA